MPGHTVPPWAILKAPGWAHDTNQGKVYIWDFYDHPGKGDFYLLVSRSFLESQEERWPANTTNVEENQSQGWKEHGWHHWSLNSVLPEPNLSWISQSPASVRSLSFIFLSKFELGFLFCNYKCPDQYVHFPIPTPLPSAPPWVSMWQAPEDLSSDPVPRNLSPFPQKSG